MHRNASLGAAAAVMALACATSASAAVQPAVTDQGDPVRQPLHLREDVRGEEDGAARGGRLGHEIVELLLHERIDGKFLKAHVEGFAQNFYLCGPDDMVKSLREGLHAAVKNYADIAPILLLHARGVHTHVGMDELAPEDKLAVARAAKTSSAESARFP